MLNYSLSSFCLFVMNQFSSYINKIDGLVEDRCNSSAFAMDLRLSGTKPSKIYNFNVTVDFTFIAKWIVLTYSPICVWQVWNKLW